MKRLTAKTKNHFRASIRTFLNWCVDKDYLEENHRLNAALKGERIQNTKPIEIYTPDEFGSILKASTGTIRILIAIAGFAGLRTAELLRLHREDILPEHIQVGKEKAKTRQRRLIPICNSLKLILQNSEHSAGPIWPTTKSTFYRDLEIIFAKAKVKQKANAFRHSFCSYRLAHTSDENLTAREAGTSPAMIYRHYGEVVTEKKGLQWFSQKT